MRISKSISIIVPTWNEESNITILVQQLHAALSTCNIHYELVFVDDRSTDNTIKILQKLKKKYPISLYVKKGKRGRSQSIIEGFSYAQYELVGTIDADLQYSPADIPLMVEKITKNVAVIVANRFEKHVGFKRKFLSNEFRQFFEKFMHGFDLDVQSGLIVLKKEVIERIALHPNQSTIGLELLVKARDAGYEIDTIDIIFHKRYSGKSKTKLLNSMIEICISAFSLAFLKREIIPFHPDSEDKHEKGFHHRGIKFIHHSNLPHHESAFHRISKSQVVVLSLIVISTIIIFLISWQKSLILIMAFLTYLYFSDLLFNLFLIFRSFHKSVEIKIKRSEITQKNTWPSYTILCPLYKEWEVLPQFVTAMSRLNYPKDKMQILLLIEDEDSETLSKVKEYALPEYFSVIIVPHSKPKTKPKALNYGLKFATGKYCVVYDAEDIPEPLQLKKAIIAFEKSIPEIVCIQAKLNFYNPHHNLLTRLFTAEYGLWFNLILPGLQSMRAPIPLGGTSNHFRTTDLHGLKGWDAFNVTEDCDLGMRLVKRGYQTAILDSLTLEEANSNYLNWFYQRSRWIKGYIQTYFVHMRRPQHLMKKWREPHLISFQLIVGGKVLSMFINPLMWLIFISYFLFRPIVGEMIESLFPNPIIYMATTSLLFGNFLYFYYYMIGCVRNRFYDLVKYIFLVPIYWLAMSAAASKTVYEIITNPHYWSKTKHGLHLESVKATQQTIRVTGNKLVDKKLLSYPVELKSIITDL